MLGVVQAGLLLFFRGAEPDGTIDQPDENACSDGRQRDGDDHALDLNQELGPSTDVRCDQSDEQGAEHPANAMNGEDVEGIVVAQLALELYHQEADHGGAESEYQGPGGGHAARCRRDGDQAG